MTQACAPLRVEHQKADVVAGVDEDVVDPVAVEQFTPWKNGWSIPGSVKGFLAPKQSLGCWRDAADFD